jgi:hypothetical protein
MLPTWGQRLPARPEDEARPRWPPPRGQECEGLAAVARRNLNCARGVLAGPLLASTRPSRWADARASSHTVSAHPGVQGSVVLRVRLVGEVMPDSAAQARTPTIMRFSTPHDLDGRPACRSIIPDPTGAHPAHPRRALPRRRPPRPARLPGHRPRPQSCPWPPPSAHRHPGLGRGRGPGRRPVGDRDRRVAADAPQPVRAALGVRRGAPGHFAVPAEATIRRTLACLDPGALAGAIGAWLTDRNCGRRAGQRAPRPPRACRPPGGTSSPRRR